MQINLSYDSSVNAAPPGFTAAVSAAAQFLDNLITSPIAVNFLVGWGEDDNGTVPIGNAYSLGGPVAGIHLNYSQLRSDLIASASTAVDLSAVASLPVNDPTNGESFYVSAAEEKALGLLPANASEVDGAIGFNSNLAYNFNTTGQGVAGEIYALNLAEVELAHALGMVLHGPMMLFRYSAPGARELLVNNDGITTPSAYFSIDDGTTNLNSYMTTLDSTLWNGPTTGPDTLAISGTPYEPHVFSQTDALELNVLGFDVNISVAAADILWQNGSGGELEAWTADGPQIASSRAVTFQGNPAVPDGTWSFAGAGDFTDDGTSDPLWRNSDGTLAEWTRIGSQVISSELVTFGGSPAVPDSSWNVAGIGDFNGVGTEDVLWLSTNGSLVDWTMNGSQVTASQPVTVGGSAVMPDGSWRIAGIGDFNVDGKADVLWRNTNGSLIDWTMNGSQIANEQQITLGGSAAMPDSSWSVVGVGDFNRDDKADVLWRNTNGSLIDWTMNGSQIANEQQITFAGSPVSLSSSWQIAQIGDFNENGTSDILWRNSDGTLAEWTMNGSQITSSQVVTFEGDPVSPANSWATLAKPTEFIG